MQCTLSFASFGNVMVSVAINFKFLLTLTHINIIYEVVWISVHRKADAALGVVSRAFPSFRNSTLEMLARQQGQAIMIWRNTPACGVAET